MSTPTSQFTSDEESALGIESLGSDFFQEFHAKRIDSAMLSCFHDSNEQDQILIDDMSRSGKQSGPPDGLSQAQQLGWYENQRRRIEENRAAATDQQRRLRDQQEVQDYVQKKKDQATIGSLEILVGELQVEISNLTKEIDCLNKIIFDKDVQLQAKDRIIAEKTDQNLRQAATIKHQSQLIANPRSSIVTPSNGQENIPRVNAAYTAPPPQFNMQGNTNGIGRSARQFRNSLSTGQYLTTNEQGSPGPRRLADTPRLEAHSRSSSSSTNPFPSARFDQQRASVQSSRPTTSSSQKMSTSNHKNSMALTVIGERDVVHVQVTLSKRFEKYFEMTMIFARGHCNSVSSEKDGNMPQYCKQLLLTGAAPAPAFPFIGKPETRFHLIGKVINSWINKEVLKGISFAKFNPEVDSIIEDTKNKTYQGTPNVIKKMYLTTNASHVARLVNAPDFKDFLSHLSREKGNQLWKVVKPMMHQKTTNDWNDLYALVLESHQLAVDMILAESEFTFENVDINDRFNPSTMINKDQSMMGISGTDLARRGAVVKLPLTPKVLARKYGPDGASQEAFVYPATVLTKWAEVRQGFSVHHLN